MNPRGFDNPNTVLKKAIEKATRETVGDYSGSDSQKLFAASPDRPTKKKLIGSLMPSEYRTLIMKICMK